MTRLHAQSRRGFTLTELAIVMGVIGAIMAGIWYGAGRVRETQKDNDAVTELQLIAQNVYNLYQGRSIPTCSGSTTLTSCMVSSQIVPSGYINRSVTTAIDSPWWPQSVAIYQMAAKKYRVSFYNVTRQGCLALATAGTACEAGQPGCPVDFYTNFGAAAFACLPSQTNCPSASPTYASNIGWGSMGSAEANAMCNVNNYTGGGNSIEFDYSL